jgi:hypothetical protein
MGGHSAWRKRVAVGGLAKGSGGASLRHRPHLGRRGVDLALNRKGNLGGHGNPKKNSKKTRDCNVNRSPYAGHSPSTMNILMKSIGVSLVVVVLLAFIFSFAVYKNTAL